MNRAVASDVRCPGCESENHDRMRTFPWDSGERYDRDVDAFSGIHCLDCGFFEHRDLFALAYKRERGRANVEAAEPAGSVRAVESANGSTYRGP